MSRKLLLITTFLAISTTLTAQDIDPSQIKAGEQIFEYQREVNGQSTTFGTIYERITKNKSDGTTLITFTQELPNVTMIDSILVNSSNFSPVSYRSFVKDMQNIRIGYHTPGETAVSMWRNVPNMQTDTTYTVSTEDRYYDFHWPHILLSVVKTDPNVEDLISLPVMTYIEEPRIQEAQHFGNDRIELNGQVFDAVKWVLKNEAQQTTSTYWFDSKTHRLIQNKSELPNGLIFWFKLKKEE